MEEIKDKSLHYTALKLAEEIKKMPMYKTFYNDIQKLVASSNVSKDSFKETLLVGMKETGLETELRNTVFQWVRSQQRTDKVDSLSYLKKANIQWEKRIHKSLNSMCADLGISLAKLRLAADKTEISEKWSELSTYDIDLTKYRPVYAPKDFLEVLLSLSGPGYERIEGEPKWEFSHIPLKVKTLDQLRAQYAELSRGEPLLGVNPNMVSSVAGFPSLELERAALGERVAALGYAPVSQEYLKRGCPRCLRAQLWAQVLGTEIHPQHVEYYQTLKNSVLQNDLMIDKLIFKDVQLTASNDDQYFVFEDLLYQVMLCFSRDHEVYAALKNMLGAPMTTTIRGKKNNSTINFPPSGVIPFHGFTMYDVLKRTPYIKRCTGFSSEREDDVATPFCYLYDDPVKLYFTFRSFYIRYWHRLHIISTHPQGIVSLCLLYERLLQAYEPTLWSHFRSVNIEPIRVVLKWLVRGFSGHLPPEQLLLLWDTVVARDSLEPLPLLAVAILSFRRESICQVFTVQSIDQVLADLSTISVMTLLQLALMKE